MTSERHNEFLAICRNVGWKCTSQRLAVYDFLRSNLTHPDVDTVWFSVRKTLPAIARESVYRILNELSEKGVISRLDNIESARYDSRTLPHGHFICEKCGAILDFDLPESDCAMPAVGMCCEVRRWEYRAVGLCGKCASSKTEK